jgi:hypothetical protein
MIDWVTLDLGSVMIGADVFNITRRRRTAMISLTKCWVGDGPAVQIRVLSKILLKIIQILYFHRIDFALQADVRGHW